MDEYKSEKTPIETETETTGDSSSPLPEAAKPAVATTEASVEPSSGPVKAAPAPTEKPAQPRPPKPEPEAIPREDFQPFYKKEARFRSMHVGFLYLLFTLTSIGLLGLVVESLFLGAPFRLEFVTIGVICFALVGLLWKTISLEAKSGLTAVGLGLLLAIGQTAHPDVELSFFGLLPGLVLPIYYCLAILACLAAVWFLWPKMHWLPLALTLVFLYAALAPVAGLIPGGLGLAGIVGGPSFVESAPIYIRPGWLMVQVFLPLGVLFFLVLQVRNLFRPQYEKHWGYLFWAFFLATASFTGLVNLELNEKPAFPLFGPLVAQVYPETAAQPAPIPGPKPTPVPSPASEEPAAPEIAQPVPEPAPEAAPLIVEPTPEPAPPAEQTGPEAAAPSTEPAPEEAPPAVAPPTIQPPATEAPSLGETEKLKKSVEELKGEVARLKEELAAQEHAIQMIIEMLRTQTPPEEEPDPFLPKPEEEEKLFPEPLPPASPRGGDYT